MDLQKLYFKALRWGIKRHPDSPVEHQRAFASAAAQLCGDDPLRPLNQRTTALANLLRISGGPSVREHACMWAAHQRGDAVQTSYQGLSAFYVDERFQMPGTWDFEFACQFCEEIAFNQLTKLHYQVWQSEPNCFDDNEHDLKALREGQYGSDMENGDEAIWIIKSSDQRNDSSS